ELRDEGDAPPRPLDALQFERTASRLGVDVQEVTRVVDDWIMERPLKYLPRVRRDGLPKLLSVLAARGLRIGALSDYPTNAKLQALGVADYFSLGLCTAERPINAFKPHPKGFRHACERWGMAPQEVMYVGDRPETDGVGAAAAGIRCVIIGRKQRRHVGDGSPAFVTAFNDLAGALRGTG